MPEEVVRLFWEIDPATLDLEKHRDYVLERIMSRGDWAAMSWLRATYSSDLLADFVRRRGARLPPRELAYWGLVSGVDVSQEKGRGRPGWAGK